MTKTESTPGAQHARQLTEAYASVGDRTWAAGDFLREHLDTSRALFVPESLEARAPVPRTVEVYALLSGLPFRDEFIEALAAAQREISSVLGDTLQYWVRPENLGVEYCVFKWPADSWDPGWLPVICRAVEDIREPAFGFHIRGVQINPDGCAVARGYDEQDTLFRIREQMKTALPFLPKKQSGWAHVPLGRILEPVGEKRFGRLGRLIREMSERRIASTVIDTLQLVHETRWYMEERSIIGSHGLGAPR